MPTTYPASEKQLALIQTLMAERTADAFVAAVEAAGLDPQTFSLFELSKKPASALITALLDQPKAKAAPAPTASLLDMAKAIETGTPVQTVTEDKLVGETDDGEPIYKTITAQIPADEDDLEAQPAIMLAFDRAECAALRSAVSIAIGETDGTPTDHALYAKIDAFLKGEAAPTEVQLPKYIGGGTEPVKPSIPAQVPAGHYAFGPDGGVKFYRVQHGKAGGKWEGFVFVDQQVSDDYVPVKDKAAKSAILARILQDGVLESAQRYGHELGVCGICHKTLTDPQSIADGIGPVCKSKIGG